MQIAGALATLPFFGGEFLPDLKEGHFILHMSAVPDTSIRETMRIGNVLTRDLHALPFLNGDIQTFGLPRCHGCVGFLLPYESGR